MAILPRPGENKMPAELKPLGGLAALPPGLMTANTPFGDWDPSWCPDGRL